MGTGGKSGVVPLILRPCTRPRQEHTRSRSPHHARSLGMLPSIQFARHDRLNTRRTNVRCTCQHSQCQIFDIRQRKNKPLTSEHSRKQNSPSCSALRLLMTFTCEKPGNMDNAPHPRESGIVTNISLEVDRGSARLVISRRVLVIK